MNSPSRNAPSLHPATSSSHLGSPKSPGRLRKMQSAHQLSNAPSLISQQRQQQQRNVSLIPPVPVLPSPEKINRTRSNSDAMPPSNTRASPKRNPSPKRNASPRRQPILRKQEDPQDGLKSLIRRGPRGDVPDGLATLRHWILVDGLEADSDGMVRPPRKQLTIGCC